MDSAHSSKICRICCNQRINELVFLLDADNKSIVKKIRACADITIEHDDLLPKYICIQCLQKLNTAYNFKIQCEYMDQKLRESIACTVQKTISLPLINPQLLNNSSFSATQESLTDELNEDINDNYDFSSDQLTMDDVETIFEEECIEEEQPMGNEMYCEQLIENDQVREMISLQIDDPVITSKVNENDGEKISMEISEKVSDTEKFDSLGTLPSAKAPEESSDQDMLSVRSEKIPSPKDIRTIKSKKSYKCETCNEVFHAHSDLTKHTKTHGKNRFQCLTCNKWFAKRYLLNAHQKTHSGAKNYACSQCDKRFTTQTNLDRHIRVYHQQERNYTCTTCQKTFSQLSTLRLHQSVHVAERKFSCDICNNKFKTEVHLKLHKKRHLPTEYRRPRKKYTPPKKVYKPKPKLCACSECDRRFKSLALLKSHMQSHSMEKKYECSFCNRRFSFQQSLRNHIFTHTGEKRFKCDICNVYFRQIGHLQGHKLTHTQVKSHTCTFCGKSFALRGNLNVHLRTHNGATPFECSICPKKFSDSNGLKRHEMIHQRKAQLNPIIEQIIEVPIIKTSINDETLPQPIFEDNISSFGSETIQFIPNQKIVVDNSQLIN